MRGNERGLTKRQLLPALTPVRSRELRQQMGEPERRLWQGLRSGLPDIKWRKQVPFGPYHADFCAHGPRIIIEVDGDDHASRESDDAARTRFLEGEGYSVMRFGNAEVMTNLEGVLASIAETLKRKGRP